MDDVTDRPKNSKIHLNAVQDSAEREKTDRDAQQEQDDDCIDRLMEEIARK